jgi:hypothetical protein
MNTIQDSHVRRLVAYRDLAEVEFERLPAVLRECIGHSILKIERAGLLDAEADAVLRRLIRKLEPPWPRSLKAAEFHVDSELENHYIRRGRNVHCTVDNSCCSERDLGKRV